MYLQLPNDVKIEEYDSFEAFNRQPTVVSTLKLTMMLLKFSVIIKICLSITDYAYASGHGVERYCFKVDSTS